MYICVYICMYVYIYQSICKTIYIYIGIYLSSYLSSSVYAWYTCVYMFMCVSTCIWKLQRSTSGSFLDCCLPYFLRQGLSENLEHTDLVVELSNSWSACHHPLPITWIPCIQHSSWFCMGSGAWTHFLMFVQQALTVWAIFLALLLTLKTGIFCSWADVWRRE